MGGGLGGASFFGVLFKNATVLVWCEDDLEVLAKVLLALGTVLLMGGGISSLSYDFFHDLEVLCERVTTTASRG